jgi:hypothetical protein
MPIMNKLFKLVNTVVMLTLVSAPLAAKDKLPQTTKDGLELQKHSKVGALYLKPGATLEPYDKIYLVDAFVAFKNNWQRDYNRDQIRLDSKISDKDIEDIKTKVASEFKAIFTDELQKAGYELVTTTGQDVMIIRPAIINLDIAAPKPDQAAFGGVTIVRGAGSLTLYAELYDSVTNDKFAEVLDTQEADEGGFAHRASTVSNKAALDSTLRRWAELLVKRLDEAHGKKK